MDQTEIDDGGEGARTGCRESSRQRQIYFSRRCNVIVLLDALIVNLSRRGAWRRDENEIAKRRLEEKATEERRDIKSNADVPRGKRIACEMARPESGKGTSAAEAGDDRYSRRETREDCQRRERERESGIPRER